MALSMPSGPRLSLSLPKLSTESLRSARPAGVDRSSAEKLWLVGGALVGFVVLLIGYFLLISPQRSSTDDVQAQVAQAQAQNDALETRLTTMRAQLKDLPRYQAELSAAQRALPSDSGVPAFLRSLQNIGSQTSTSVMSVSVGAPTALTVATTTTTSAASSASTSSPNGTTTGAATATSSVLSLAITAQVTGTTSALNEFLAQLQSVQPRAVVITALTEAAGGATAGSSTAASNSGVTLSLSMLAFVAPTSGAASASTTSGP